MKRRGIFAIAAGMIAALGVSLKKLFETRPTYSVGAYRGEGRSAFLSISTPRCHTQRYKNKRARI